MANTNDYITILESWRRVVKESEELQAQTESDITNKINSMIKSGLTGEQIYNDLSKLEDFDYLSDIQDNDPIKAKTINKINSSLRKYRPGDEKSIDNAFIGILTAVEKAYSLSTVAAAPTKFKPLGHIKGFHPASNAELAEFVMKYAVLASLPLLFDAIMSLLSNLDLLGAGILAAIAGIILNPGSFMEWLGCVAKEVGLQGLSGLGNLLKTGLTKIGEWFGMDPETGNYDAMAAFTKIVTSISNCFKLAITSAQATKAAEKLAQNPETKKLLDELLKKINDKIKLPDSGYDSSYADMPHVGRAIQELKNFKNGSLKERDPEAWPFIATYWQNTGHGWLARATLRGEAYHPDFGNQVLSGWKDYESTGDNKGRIGYICTAKAGGPKKKVVMVTKKVNGKKREEVSKYGYDCKEKPNHWHWSGTFIEWCMQENEAFQPDRLPAPPKVGLGNHRRYWIPARNNRNKLKAGGKLRDDDWIYLTVAEQKKIGYKIKVGDITLQRPQKKHHADIVIAVDSSGKPKSVGGNLSNKGGNTGTVKVSTAPVTGIMTQRKEAKDLYVKHYVK